MESFGHSLPDFEIKYSDLGAYLLFEGIAPIVVERGRVNSIPIEKLLRISESPLNFSSFLEYEIILGSALVLALALNQTWSLHASAAFFNRQVVAFLGDSGQGKSTLAAYLENQLYWQRLADDILPVCQTVSGIDALPHFPQLKLPVDAQPGFNFPESLPLDKLFLLKAAAHDTAPKVKLLPAQEAIQVVLGHTAGTRLFTPALLEKHVYFSAHVAERVPVYQLTYPHDKDKLSKVKELLEKICSL